MKDKYYDALKVNNGQMNEIDLGEQLGLDENTTRHIIVRLMSEHKIEYAENGACNYCIMKTAKSKSNRKSKKQWTKP